MKKSIVLFLIAMMFFMTNNLHAQTAMFGVTPQHTGVYSSSFPQELKLEKKWKFKTNGMIFSSAVIVNDVIYFGSDDSCLYAIDESGTLKWKFKTNGIIRSTPAVNDSVVFFINYGGQFYAVSTSTGKELWSFATDGELHFSHKGLFNWTPADSLMNDPWDFYTSSPVISDSIVCFGSGKNVYALNNQTGALIWKYTTTDIIHSTPAVSNGMIYFGGWSGNLYALDAITGKEKWKVQTGTDPSHLMQGIQSSPSVIDTMVVFGARDASVYALNAMTGKKIWSTNFGGTWMPSSIACSNGTIFTGSSEGKGFQSLNLLTGKLNYSISKNFYLTFSTPAIASETAFVGCLNGSLFSIDVNSGKIKCRFDTDGRKANPINAILPDGSLNPIVFSPVSGAPYDQAVEYVRRVLTAGSIASTPAIDKNVVYFGSSDSCFYAIHDAGGCKPNFKVSTNKIIFAEPVGSMIDTVIYISSKSECNDSVRIYASNFTASLKNSFDIQPANFISLPNDSVGVRIKVNTTSLRPGKSYAFKIISQSKSNEYIAFTTDISFNTRVATKSSQITEQKADVLYPNPFTDYTLLKYSLERNCRVDIRIYNLSGELMNVLVNQNQKIGEHTLTWNGTNSNGFKLSPGIYLCSILKGNSLTCKKMVIETK